MDPKLRANGAEVAGEIFGPSSSNLYDVQMTRSKQASKEGWAEEQERLIFSTEKLSALVTLLALPSRSFVSSLSCDTKHIK